MPINKNKPKKAKKVNKEASKSNYQEKLQSASRDKTVSRKKPKKASSTKSSISYMNPDGLGKDSPMPKKKKSYMSYKKGGLIQFD